MSSVKGVLLLWIGLIVSVLLFGCSLVTTTASSVADSYFPHEDGYAWEYRCYFMDGTLETSVLKRTRYFDGTTELSSDLIVQNFMVTDEVSAFGISIFSNIQMFMVPSIALQNYLYVADTGVYDYGGHDDPTTEATLIVPLPLEIGKGWERGRASSFEAVAEEDVVVPAGNYKAMKVFLDEDGLGEAAYYEWYAQDVGMIKSAMTFSYAPMVIDIDGRAIPSTMEVEGSYIEELVRKNF